MSDDIKENISDTGIWLRFVFMLLFAAIFCVIRLVLGAVIVGQFLWVLFTTQRNKPLLGFANQLASYLYQIYRYLSFNTEQRPFPFEDFPTSATLVASEQDEAESAADESSADETPSETTSKETAASEEATEKKPARTGRTRASKAKQEAEEKAAAETAEADTPASPETDSSDVASESGIEAEEPKKS